MPRAARASAVGRRPAGRGRHFDPALLTALERAVRGRPDARRGAMFGYPAYYTRGKLFACVHDDRIVLKLPAATVAKVVGTRGIGRFTIRGRTMREWVMIAGPRAAALGRRPALILQSLAFVRATTAASKKGA